MIRRFLFLLACLSLGIFGLYQARWSVFADEERPDGGVFSGADSRLKQAYDFLVGKGDNYGVTDAADWDSTTNNWGTYWNRIMEAAAWEPDGSATAGDVPSGFTFYAGNGDRTIKTGTMFELQANIAYDDYRCSNNNQEAEGTCAIDSGDYEYIDEEGVWTLVSDPGGTPASVTGGVPEVTVSLLSNKVYQDNWTKLYWTDRTNEQVDNEFKYVNGADRVDPGVGVESCNFNSLGTANQYCDNQDPLNAYVEDDDVSAAEFCLNLSLDDGSGVKTDWRLPTQKELMQAYINGAANNLPNVAASHWSSTEYFFSQSYAWSVDLIYGYTIISTKDSASRYARCIRRD